MNLYECNLDTRGQLWHFHGWLIFAYFATWSAFTKGKSRKCISNWSENEACYIFVKIKTAKLFRRASFFTILWHRITVKVSTYTVAKEWVVATIRRPAPDCTLFVAYLVFTLDGLLTIGDFHEVYAQLYRRRAKWCPLGLQLCLTIDFLENIEHDCTRSEQCLEKMVYGWLRRPYLKPTWQSLIDGLSHPTVGEESAAYDLRWFVNLGGRTGAAIKVQSVVRMFLARQEYVRVRGAAITIQSHYRGYTARRQLQNEHKAAVTIQRCYRPYMERQHYLQLKKAAVCVQTHRRALVLARKEQRIYEATRKAVIRMQACFRGLQDYKHYHELKRAVTILQAHTRAVQARRRYVNTRSAVISAQAFARGWLARGEFARSKERIVKLQAYSRGSIAQLEYKRTRQSLIKAQAYVRGFLGRTRYAHSRASIVKVQSYARAHLARRSYQRHQAATICFQKFTRGYLARKQFSSVRRATVTIQSHTRGFLARKQYRQLRSTRQRPKWFVYMAFGGIVVPAVIGVLIQSWSSVTNFWTEASQ